MRGQQLSDLRAGWTASRDATRRSQMLAEEIASLAPVSARWRSVNQQVEIRGPR